MCVKHVKRPCVSCIYFDECGSTSRTVPCHGRKTRREKERERKEEKENV